MPYDRPLTTMAGFAMCALCAAEYDDPADRRFHAQPVCCPAAARGCGCMTRRGTPLPGEPLAAAAGLLRQGRCSPSRAWAAITWPWTRPARSAAAALRARKHREDKPFAVMVADVAAARQLCEVDDGRRVAADQQPPADRAAAAAAGRPVAAAVAPGNRQLGVMLPYTPLHHLLVRAGRRPDRADQRQLLG